MDLSPLAFCAGILLAFQKFFCSPKKVFGNFYRPVGFTGSDMLGNAIIANTAKLKQPVQIPAMFLVQPNLPVLTKCWWINAMTPVCLFVSISTFNNKALAA